MLFLAWFKCPDKTGKKSADVGEQYLDLIQYRGPDGSPTLKSADQFTGVWLCNYVLCSYGALMVEWSALRKSFLMIGCVNLRSDRGTIAPANRQEIRLERYFKGAIKTIYERAVKMNDLSKLSQ